MDKNFIDKNGKLFLVHCPKCKCENYLPAVATGKCAWCGFDANKVDEKKEQE
jgi:ribosomal protein L37E